MPQPYFTAITFNLTLLSLPIAGVLIWLKPAWRFHIFAAFFGLLAAFIDSQAGEVQIPALLVLSFSFFLGVLHPVRFWRWAVLTGGGIPLLAFIKYFLYSSAALEPHATFVSQVVGSCLALVLSFVGCFVGSLIGRSSPVMTASGPASDAGVRDSGQD